MKIQIWRLNSEYGFNKDDIASMDCMLRKMASKTKKQAENIVTMAKHRAMLRDYAFRVMFKGHRYPEGHKRPSDTLPVWKDPDD